MDHLTECNVRNSINLRSTSFCFPCLVAASNLMFGNASFHEVTLRTGHGIASIVDRDKF